MNIYYYYPNCIKPSGGHKQLRLQALLAQELGVRVHLLRNLEYWAKTSQFEDSHYYNIPNTLAPFPFEESKRYINKEDLIIFPEVSLSKEFMQCHDWNVRIGVNNQNGFWGLRFNPGSRHIKGRVEFAFANAPYVARLCRKFYRLPPERIFLIPHWVLRPPFEDAPPNKSSVSISYMPRKLPELTKTIRNEVQKQRPMIPWVEIDGVPEPRVAELMGSTSIFFAAHDLEGCPLTALEAMARGNLIVGFPGTRNFRHPYSTAENGLWVKDRDISAAINATVRAIDLVTNDPRRHIAFLEAGQRTVANFSKLKVTQSLNAAIQCISTQSYKNNKTKVSNLTWTEYFQAFRTLYEYDRLGVSGKILSWLSLQRKKLFTNFI